MSKWWKKWYFGMNYSFNYWHTSHQAHQLVTLIAQICKNNVMKIILHAFVYKYVYFCLTPIFNLLRTSTEATCFSAECNYIFQIVMIKLVITPGIFFSNCVFLLHFDLLSMDKVYKQMKSKARPIQRPLVVLCGQEEWKWLFFKMRKKRENSTEKIEEELKNSRKKRDKGIQTCA